MTFTLDQSKLEEAIIQRAADELVDRVNLRSVLNERLVEIVDRQFRDHLNSVAEAVLKEAGDRALNEVITPVNTWGEKVGEATTLKQVIHDRARDFWSEKVGNDGKAKTYGGTPRFERLLLTHMKAAFTETMLEDATGVVSGLKQAMKTDILGRIDDVLSNAFRKVGSK